MTDVDSTSAGPDLALGVPLASIPTDGILAGHVGGESVLLSRKDNRVFAVSGKCTHYGGPLAHGLVAGCEVRCPWHHACFDLRTGASLSAPAFAPLATWRVEIVGDSVHVREPATTIENPPRKLASPDSRPQRIVIIGAGAAGFSAAHRLRQLGFAGSLTLLSADTDAPYDRPNLSKEYLAGSAPEDWMPLQSDAFYRDQDIHLQLACEVSTIDVDAHNVHSHTGPSFPYDRLLLATGAEPAQLDLPGFSLPTAFILRSMADARAIIRAAEKAHSVALIGAGFIGLEVASALRARGLTAHVIAREADPMAKILGPDLAAFIIDLHRQHGVQFHLQRSPAGYDGHRLQLDDGSSLTADLLITGVGVRPRIGLAERAGLKIDRGVLVNERLQTSNPDIYAAGDIARFPRDGDLIRVEHWVHAERQGQRAAANMLGHDQPFTDVPFFWTHHYGLDLRYSGHAQNWDEAHLDGSLSAHDATVRFLRGGKLLAAATLGRDLENLEIEAQLQQSAEA